MTSVLVPRCLRERLGPDALLEHVWGGYEDVGGVATATAPLF
jgi:hypothetical protein